MAFNRLRAMPWAGVCHDYGVAAQQSDKLLLRVSAQHPSRPR